MHRTHGLLLDSLFKYLVFPAFRIDIDLISLCPLTNTVGFAGRPTIIDPNNGAIRY